MNEYSIVSSEWINSEAGNNTIIDDSALSSSIGPSAPNSLFLYKELIVSTNPSIYISLFKIPFKKILIGSLNYSSVY